MQNFNPNSSDVIRARIIVLHLMTHLSLIWNEYEYNAHVTTLCNVTLCRALCLQLQVDCRGSCVVMFSLRMHLIFSILKKFSSLYFIHTNSLLSLQNLRLLCICALVIVGGLHLIYIIYTHAWFNLQFTPMENQTTCFFCLFIQIFVSYVLLEASILSLCLLVDAGSFFAFLMFSDKWQTKF